MSAVKEWVTLVGAVIAAVVGVTGLWLQVSNRWAVAWTLRDNLISHTTQEVANIGRVTARRVEIRVGSAADPEHATFHRSVDEIDPGGAVMVVLGLTFGAPQDSAVVVTWQPLFGRRRTWTRLLL